MFLVSFLIETLQESDGFQVLAAAVPVGDPFAFFARVVQIEHGGDGVHAQAVGMVAIEPEHTAGKQEAAHLAAAVVENQRLPVGMKSLAGIGMLVEMRAIEVGEAVTIGGEVGRHPVKNHADAVLVQAVHQIHEVLWCAVARRWREVAGRLISPGGEVGMLHDRQKFDMGEPHLAGILGQTRTDLPIAEGAVVVAGIAHP